MKNINIIIIFTIALIFACDDEFLERSDPGSGSVENFYNTEDELVYGINGVYNAFQGDWWGGSLIHIQPHLDGATDNATICCPWEYGFPAVGDGTMTPTTGSIVAWKWDYGYQALTRVNQMLQLIDEGIPGMEDANATKWTAELRFLRGFIHFEMMNVYGDIPLVLSVLSPEEAQELGRTPKDQVFAEIIKDMQFAADNLDTTPNRGDIGRPSKQTALGYIGKFYMYEGQFDKAADYLGQVIAMEGGAISLDPDYESLFNGTNEASKEILFSFQAVGDGVGEGSYMQVHYAPPNFSGITSGGWNSMQYTKELIDDYYMTDGQSIQESPLYDENDMYANRDPRLAWTFLRMGDTWAGLEMEDRNFFYNGAAPNQEYAANVISKKWCNEDVLKNDDTGIDFILLRYADILLMYAEAQNEVAGPASVYSAVNKVRARSNMPDFPAGLSKDQMRDEIRHERRIEFVMEGSRYYDLIRWGTAEDVIPSVPELQNRVFDPAKNYLWPIPQTAVDSNPTLIKQNPGY